MRKNEKSFILIVIIGLILKLSLLPIGHWIMLIGIGLLANSYFFGFSSIVKNESYTEYTNSRKEDNKKLYVLIPSYSIVIIIVGALFKIMTWPGADLILISGVILLGIGVYFVLNKADEEKPWKTEALKRLVSYGIIGAIMYALPTFFWFEIVYRENPQYISATKAFYADPENEAKRALMETEYKKMEDGI